MTSIVLRGSYTFQPSDQDGWMTPDYYAHNETSRSWPTIRLTARCARRGLSKPLTAGAAPRSLSPATSPVDA